MRLPLAGGGEADDVLCLLRGFSGLAGLSCGVQGVDAMTLSVPSMRLLSNVVCKTNGAEIHDRNSGLTVWFFAGTIAASVVSGVMSNAPQTGCRELEDVWVFGSE